MGKSHVQRHPAGIGEQTLCQTPVSNKSRDSPKQQQELLEWTHFVIVTQPMRIYQTQACWPLCKQLNLMRYLQWFGFLKSRMRCTMAAAIGSAVRKPSFDHVLSCIYAICTGTFEISSTIDLSTTAFDLTRSLYPLTNELFVF
eukprot:TRINITY_DN11400_c0_g1_i1.p1 TRINITY_DN11400_c0_g1~~TRINITY_DN11400_c0_g1_i1.p1  ORF type:complete len:143 (+),score=16.44 TRINITY_DN11400_c0_g1_i1:139-567(+)